MTNPMHQHRTALNRRDLLRFGGLSAVGLGLAGQLWGEDTLKKASGQAKNVILIWLDGGPSHLETFDLKPKAPSEVRGPLKPIQTKVPGVTVGECLPRTGAIMDRVAVIRSMTSPLGEHNFGTHYMMTGYKPTPVLEYPVLGSTWAHLRPGENGVLPPHVAIPSFRVGGSKISGNGFLEQSMRPFSLDADPSRPNFSVRDLGYYAEVTSGRLSRRRRFLNQLDDFQRKAENSKQPSGDPIFEQAYRLITSKTAKEAFQLEDEPSALRQRYGNKTVGQSCLLARRLVERGVPCVTVVQRGWDTHSNLYTRLKEGYTGARTPVGLIPSLDLAFSTLVEDLQQRRLLDETLVLVMGEFGRTPKLNTQGGRDHWPRVFSVAAAGGGIRGGTIIGSSDKVGESPHDNPVRPEDLLHTVYTLLGVDPKLELNTADGRPVRLTHPGSRLIKELMA